MKYDKNLQNLDTSLHSNDGMERKIVMKAVSSFLWMVLVFPIWISTGMAAIMVVNVDFQPGGTGIGDDYSDSYSGQAAFPDLGNNVWNIVAPAPNGGGFKNADESGGYAGTAIIGAPLVLSSGAGTAITLDVGDTDVIAMSALSHPAYGAIASDAKGLMSDYLQTGEFKRYVNLNNLTPGRQYTLYLYGAGPYDDRETQFTVSNGTGGTWGQGTSGIPGGSHTLTLGQDYVLIPGVTTATGFLGIEYESIGAAPLASFNGFQLTWEYEAIPEPSTMAMLGLGVGVLALARLKMRAKQ